MHLTGRNLKSYTFHVARYRLIVPLCFESTSICMTHRPKAVPMATDAPDSKLLWLLELAEQHGDQAGQGTVIRLGISQDELARQVGAALVTTHRALRELRE